MISEIHPTPRLQSKKAGRHRFATLGAKALFCLKGACETAQPLGITLGIMISTDSILKEVNREPIFTPILGGILN